MLKKLLELVLTGQLLDNFMTVRYVLIFEMSYFFQIEKVYILVT